MTVELKPATEQPNLNLPPFSLEFDLFNYEIELEDLGISGKSYISEEWIAGRKEGNYAVFYWLVLAPESTPKDLPTTTQKKIHQHSKRLREDVSRYGKPIEVHTSFVRSEREHALVGRLKQNNIFYSFSN